jgi:hypothetical protein
VLFVNRRHLRYGLDRPHVLDSESSHAQGVVGFLDFTWHLALALADKAAVPGKDQWGPRILPRRQQRATSAAIRLHLQHDTHASLASIALLVALPCKDLSE